MKIVKKYLPIILFIFSTSLMLMPHASAQSFSFGDNDSEYAHDGECDDPRFAGPGMANSPSYADIAHDAADCSDLYYDDLVYFYQDLELFEDETSNNDDDFYDVEESDEFGNNTSGYAHDGECDDPRFYGSGMASVLSDNDIANDAADCRQQYIQGNIYWK